MPTSPAAVAHSKLAVLMSVVVIVPSVEFLVYDRVFCGISTSVAVSCMAMVSPGMALWDCIAPISGSVFDSDTVMCMSCRAMLFAGSVAVTVTRYTVFILPPCPSDGVHSSRPAEDTVGIGVPVTL